MTFTVNVAPLCPVNVNTPAVATAPHSSGSARRHRRTSDRYRDGAARLRALSFVLW